MKSFPLSLWELRQLKFLNLSWMEIENVDECIGNLSSLQFLNPSHCMKFKSLPSQIVKLKNMRYFDFSECDNRAIGMPIKHSRQSKKVQSGLFILEFVNY